MRQNLYLGRCSRCLDDITVEGGWADAGSSRYCFKEECQKEFYIEARAIIRTVNTEMAKAMERGAKDA